MNASRQGAIIVIKIVTFFNKVVNISFRRNYLRKDKSWEVVNALRTIWRFNDSSYVEISYFNPQADALLNLESNFFLKKFNNTVLHFLLL